MNSLDQCVTSAYEVDSSIVFSTYNNDYLPVVVWDLVVDGNLESAQQGMQ